MVVSRGMGLKPLNAILVATGLVLVSLNLALAAYATGQVPAVVEEACCDESEGRHL